MTEAERYDEAAARALEVATLRAGRSPAGSGFRQFLREEMRTGMIAAIEAAVAEETARCAEAVALMKNQRQAYREILRNPTAQLPKHGHWADPFFADAEAAIKRGDGAG